MVTSRSIHVTGNAVISGLSMAEKYSIVYMYNIFLSHSSVDGYLGCFHVLAIEKNAVMNIAVHVSVFVSRGFLRIDAQEWDCQIKW